MGRRQNLSGWCLIWVENGRAALLICLTQISLYVARFGVWSNFGLRLAGTKCRNRGWHMESDFIYFRQRAAEERTAALQTRNRFARRAHVEMADQYEDRVRAIAVRQQPADG
jgi:hypothetical protein